MVDANAKRINSKWMPFLVVVSYTTGTMFVSFWGPIQYSGYNKLLVFAYVIAFLTATWFGSIIGFGSKTLQYPQASKRRSDLQKASLLMAFFVLFVKITLMINSFQIYGIPNANSFYMILASSYTMKSLEVFSEGNFFRQVDTFTYFMYVTSLCLTLYYWKSSGKLLKTVVLLNILLTLTYNTLYLGDQKAFLDTAIYFVSAFAVAKARKGVKLLTLRQIVMIILISALGLLFFSSIVMARRLSWGSRLSPYLGDRLYLDLEHPSLSIFPEALRYQVGSFLIYPTMGWYGLSLTLQLPFEWSYLLGGFRGINSILSQVIPDIPNMYRFTYLARMEMIYGYDGLANWHTIFPWLASDFTFIGTILFMGLLGYAYSKSWRQSIENDNPISFSVFALLNIMYVYITANNQLFVQRGTSLASIIILGFWVFFGRKFNASSQEQFAGGVVIPCERLPNGAN